MPYAQYLQTAHWRRVRDRALRLAGHRCAKCTTKRGIQVHHLTYERRGAELDEDLQVLCRGCHLGLHVQEAREGIGVYLKLVSEALNAGTFATLDDLLEDVKCRCAQARIPYASGQVHAAVARAEIDRGLKFGAQAPKKYATLLDANTGNQPFTHAEACGLIAKFAAQSSIRPMPAVTRMTRHEADTEIVRWQLIALIQQQIEKCDEAEAVVRAETPA